MFPSRPRLQTQTAQSAPSSPAGARREERPGQGQLGHRGTVSISFARSLSNINFTEKLLIIGFLNQSSLKPDVAIIRDMSKLINNCHYNLDRTISGVGD